MQTWKNLKHLEFTLEDYILEGLSIETSSGWTRRTTLIHLRGQGLSGSGEDVHYAADVQAVFQARGADLPLAGKYDLESFSRKLDEVDDSDFGQTVEAHYRRWAYESAALDLALKQNELDAPRAFGRSLKPLTFGASTGLKDFGPIAERLAIHADMRFKLDAVVEWDEELCAKLAATGAVDVVDFKGAYHGTIVDTVPDLALYKRVVSAFAETLIIEDPHDTPEVLEFLRECGARVSWDYPIRSAADFDAMPHPPACINIKPSRFGTLEALCEAYDTCFERDLPMYGGGQFELGIGREQIQVLAALFHPGGSNDVAPRGYHQLGSDEPKPASPLQLTLAGSGFGLASE